MQAKTFFPPIQQETRTHVPTEQAAYYLNRKQQTLRLWHCKDNGVIRPRRISGRLAWPVAEIKQLLGIAE